MAVVFILDVAVAARAIGRETPCQVLGERAGNRALGLEITVLAQGGFDAALGSKTRRARTDIDHASRGVLAEQRALGAAQNLKLLNVHQVEHRHTRAPEVDVVDIQPHAAFQAIAGRVVAQATDRHAGLARMHIGDVDAGHQLLQILDAIHPLGFQGLAADHAHGRRHGLGTFGPPPGSHRDGLQLATGAFALAGRRGGFSGLGRRPTGTAGHQHRQGQGLEQTHKRLQNPGILVASYS